MAKSFERLLYDEAFAGRQPKLLLIIARILKYTGFLKLMKRIPPGFVTPMEFVCLRSPN